MSDIYANNDAEACCHGGGATGTDGASSEYQRVIVYWTEINYELALFLTIEDMGIDLRSAIIDFDYGKLDDDDRKTIFDMAPENLPGWLSEQDIDFHNLSWGETPMWLPKGWTLTKGAKA